MGTHNISILYIQNKKENRQLYIPTLEKVTNKLYIADTIKDGINLYKKHKPELLISDLNTPPLNGFEMITKIKKIKQSVKIIVLTKHCSQEDFIKALNVGVNGILIKPFKKSELLENVKKQIQEILFYKNLNNTRTEKLQKEISERIQAEEMLRESEEKYRQIFENANDGIMLTVNGIVKFINPKLYEITGYLPKESISKPFTQFVHPDYREIVYNNHMGRLRGENIPERYDIQAFTKSGELRWFELKSALIQWENQQAVLTFITDISERKKTASQLQELNLRLEKRVQEELKKIKDQQQLLIQKSKLESLGELAAGIAHEINQPLGAITLLLDNIQYNASKGKLTLAYLNKKIKQSFKDIDRIRMIIDHIRAFSRDQDKEGFTKIDAHEIIMNALGMIKNQYNNQNVCFELNLVSQHSYIIGNPFKLEQVFLNLFSNSKFALDEKANAINDKNYQKTIRINTCSEDTIITISVEDNGTGIEKNIQKNIFDPFFTTKPENIGTGLGLSISYGILKEMKGNIEIQSEKGKYTKIIIKIPLIKN